MQIISIYKSNEVIEIYVNDDSLLVHFLEHRIFLNGIPRSLCALGEIVGHFPHFSDLSSRKIGLRLAGIIGWWEDAQVNRILFYGLGNQNIPLRFTLHNNYIITWTIDNQFCSTPRRPFNYKFSAIMWS